jgi:hypothetical protein
MVYFNSSSCHCMELKKMNTSVQVKTHTNHSASIRNVENLRESEQFKNPHIEILKRTPDYKFEDDVIPPTSRADIKSEQQRQDELRKVNNKINTYGKRLEMFKFNDNHKKVESLTKQICNLQMQKEQLKEQKSAPETRGKKREKNYVELIFSLTNSNKWIENTEMQSVLKRAFERMKKTKIIKQLEGITGAMHLDQHSLHIHYIGKIPDNTTWDDIVKDGFENNPLKTVKENAKEKRKFSSKTYKNIQNTFQKFVKDEIWRSNLQNKSSLTSFTHSKGRKYLPLKQFKAQNPLENKKVEEIIEEEFEELVEAPRESFLQRLEEIKNNALQKEEVKLKEEVEESTTKQQKKYLNIVSDLQSEAKREILDTKESDSSNLEEKKEVQEEEVKGKVRRDR